tara:strand:- start:745 stop:1017 length:273 start_codon:yes stop_codon:yes gene_type:complete
VETYHQSRPEHGCICSADEGEAAKQKQSHRQLYSPGKGYPHGEEHDKSDMKPADGQEMGGSCVQEIEVQLPVKGSFFPGDEGVEKTETPA